MSTMEVMQCRQKMSGQPACSTTGTLHYCLMTAGMSSCGHVTTAGLLTAAGSAPKPSPDAGEETPPNACQPAATLAW